MDWLIVIHGGQQYKYERYLYSKGVYTSLNEGSNVPATDYWGFTF